MDLPAVENAPQWHQVQHEVLCPLCDYNLRGLIQPRCPECGLAFDWNEVLDPGRIRHPYLFEHHPRRWIWSFVLTLFHGLRPSRFWTTLRPTHRPYPKRIFLYWLILATLVLAGPVADFGSHVCWEVQKLSPIFGRDSMGWYLQIEFRSSVGQRLIDTFICVAWAWLTFGSAADFSAVDAHPLAMVVASQIIVGLLAAVIILSV